MLKPINKILYASSLADDSRETFKVVATLALAHQAEVVLVYALEPEILYTADPMGGSIVADYMLTESLKEAEPARILEVKQRLMTFCEEELGEGVQLPKGEPRIRVEEGEPSDVILNVAEDEDVDLIVMGSRTHSKLGQALLGSNANTVVHQSKRPTLIVPLGQE